MSIQLMELSSQTYPAVIAKLHDAMSETTVETAKAQTYHWNVKGMAFGPLHQLFQEIYEDHFVAQDMLAERMKSLGSHVDGRMVRRLDKSSISECDGTISSREMVEKLAQDQKILSSTLLSLARVADECDDEVTNDMAIERAAIHDKFAWMLSVHLAE